MEKEMDCGGSAFPLPSGAVFVGDPCQGMSYRDWLAGQALLGMLSHGHNIKAATDGMWSAADLALRKRSLQVSPVSQ